MVSCRRLLIGLCRKKNDRGEKPLLFMLETPLEVARLVRDNRAFGVSSIIRAVRTR
jgi:hypothetical protein